MAENATIRLNQVLRMFNISLDKAILLFWSRGYEVEARPTTKIKFEHFEVLYDELKRQNYFKGQPERTAKEFYNHYIDSRHREKTVPEKQSGVILKKKRIRRSSNGDKRDLDAIHVYEESDCYKIIAKLKWYYNRQTEGEYGFLQYKGLPDIRFYGNSVLGVDPHHLSKGQEVVVTLKKIDIEYGSSLKALRVNLLKDETNIKYLVHLCLKSSHHNLVTKEIIIQLEDRISSLKSNEKINLEKNIVAGFVGLSTITLNQAEVVHYLLEKIKYDGLPEIEQEIFDKLSSESHVQFWMNCNNKIPFGTLKTDILNYLIKNEEYYSPVLEKLRPSKQEEVLNALFDFFKDGEENFSVVRLAGLKSYFDKYEAIFPHNELSQEQLFQIWLLDALDYLPVDAIYTKLLQLSGHHEKEELEENTRYLADTINSIFSKSDEDEVKEILSKCLYEIEDNDSASFNFVWFILRYLPKGKNKTNFVDKVYHRFSDYYKLKLFVLDYTDNIDYNNVVIYTALLKSEEQKLFFKKVLKLKEDRNLILSLQDLDRITTIDYQTSEYGRMIDVSQLDFSLSVIVQLLKDLSQGVITKRNTIFDLVARQIKQPEDLLVIEGFFEECKGRTVLARDRNQDSDGESEYSYHKEFRFDDMPRFSNYCAGRKALKRISGEPSLCNKSGLEFWWCENRQCYEIARKSHGTDDWKNYTLEDALRILNIPYQTSQYEILLGVINRVNRFLKHLTCRKCNKILKPKGNSNYAFYNVTTFSCQDAECTEHGRQIYLSHCSNGKCEDIIDSRDCVKCKPKGFDPDCGWYICKSCNSCCSSENLERRKYIIERTGQEYKCHTIGHKDQGIKCCSKCGEEMTRAKSSQEVYLNQLNWFIENKEKHPNVSKYGQRQGDNKWWFIWNRGQFEFQQYRRQLKGMRNSGFNVPNYDVLENESQLVAEPNQWAAYEIHECPGCGNSLETKIGN